MAKIIAPNKKYNGTSASIPFINGVGETDNQNLIQWFKENGYTLEENVSFTENAPVNEKNSIPDLANMTADELIKFANNNGFDIGKSTSKDSILKKILLAGGDPNDGTKNEGNGEAPVKVPE